MIGGIFFMTSRGEVVLSRIFRDGVVVRNVADIFRDEIIATKQVERSPINMVDKQCFIHFRHQNLLLVAVGRPDMNVFLVIQMQIKLMQIITDYFGHVSESVIKNHFTVVQELIDETMDYGYPQITETQLLKSYVTESAGIKGEAVQRARDAERVTINATGKIPWRKEGIVYSENELFTDVVEEVNLLMNQQGEVLQRDIVGRVVVRCFLSGMPDCLFVINDRTIGSRGGAQAGQTNEANERVGGPVRDGPVELDDVSFHPCVRLGDFDADRTITFVPPDGEFVLMRYRTSGNLVPPIKILSSRAKEISKTRLELDFHLQCDMDPKYFAASVVVKIPCPANTANAKVRVLVGKAKYDPAEQAILWKLKRMDGGTTTPFSAEVNLISITSNNDAALKPHGRPPIAISFSTETYSASGFRLERVKVTEPRLMYEPRKWLRYISRAGQYQCRM